MNPEPADFTMPSALSDELCAAGRRLSSLGFVVANEGNLSARVDDHLVLCTPTMMHKGDLRSDDLCLVDFSLRQLAGRRRPTSEIRLHLEIYRADPATRAVVHCHSPHATAFAVCGISPPAGILPEPELMLGEIALIPYQTPGTQEFAASITPCVAGRSAAILANHGQVAWGRTVREALWRAELLEAYCRILTLARSLGEPRPIPDAKLRELLALRPNFDLPPDPRLANGA